MGLVNKEKGAIEYILKVRKFKEFSLSIGLEFSKRKIQVKDDHQKSFEVGILGIFFELEILCSGSKELSELGVEIIEGDSADITDLERAMTGKIP